MHVLPPIGVADPSTQASFFFSKHRAMLIPVTAMQSHKNSSRSFHSALVSALSQSTNHLAFFLRVFGILSAMSVCTRSTTADPAASVSAASPTARSYLRWPVVHQGHSYRLLRAYIVDVIVATQELIVQCYLLPVLQIRSSDDRLHFVVKIPRDVSHFI